MLRSTTQRNLPAIESQKRSWQACEQALEQIYLGPCRAWSKARQSYSGAPVSEFTVKTILRAINRKIGQNAEMWWSAQSLAVELGLQSDETVLRAYDALECRGLIHVREQWSGRIRQLRVRIDWCAVFGGTPQPTNRRQAREAPARQRHVSTNSGDAALSFCGPRLHNPRSTSPLLVAHVSTISGIPHTPYIDESEIEPPIQPENEVGGWVDSFERRETRDERREPEGAISTMPTRTITAAEDSLTQRLVSLGVGLARPTVREALRLGYTPEAVEAILEWFDAQARSDSRGKVWRPYSPAQLVWRLRDGDAIGAAPEHGDWKGGKCGIWSAIPAARSPQPSVAQIPARSPEEMAGVIARLQVSEERHGATVDAMTKDECQRLLAGNPLGLASLSRWSGHEPKKMTLRTAIKYALEKKESDT